MMHIAIVMQNDYPHIGEVRMRRIARSLSRQGHRVTILAWNSGRGPQTEDLGYAQVVRFDLFAPRSFASRLSAPSPFNIFWAMWIRKVARQIQPDLFIVSNIRIAWPAILAARTLHKPLILDLQEHNEELVRTLPKTSLAHYLTRNGHLVGVLERACVRLADHTWVVVEERIKSLPASVVRRGKVTVVGNAAELEEAEVAEDQGALKDPVFTLILIGQLQGNHTSASPFIEAMGYVVKRDRNVLLLLGGVIGNHDLLDKLVKQAGIEQNVRVEGLIPPEEVPRWLRQGHVGIVPYTVSPYTNATISCKLFHYLAAGLPVLSTAMEPTRRVIEELQCGAVIPDGSGPQEIADIILRLKNSGEELSAMGRRAQQGVKEKYNWDVDFERGFRSIEALLSPARWSVAARVA